MEFAELTTARITQILNLLVLAPDIQEQILFMAPVTNGDPPVTEKTLRPVLQTLVWSEQRERWVALRTDGPASDRTPAPLTLGSQGVPGPPGPARSRAAVLTPAQCSPIVDS
jgi:hypothetical protein